MKRSIITSVFIAIAICSLAQDLPRRSFLGIQMQEVTDDVKKLMGLTENYGVLINGTVPRSTAEKAGFKKGDILLSINNERLDNIQEAISFVAAQTSGSDFSYELIRDKKRITGHSSFAPYPKEQYPDIEMEYAAVKTPTGLQRVIISKPRGAAKHPAIVFIGGIGCYSLESPFDSARSEVQLLNKLTRNGYIVARVEKPGIGDGAGYSKKCNEISFTEEKEIYVQAINDLKKRQDVEAGNIYIIGHSMGGVMGPLVASETSVKGIIAYGTIGSNFIEYMLKTRRTEAAAHNWGLEETDTYIKEVCECTSWYFVDKMTTAEAAKKKPICRDYLEVFDFRSRKYNDELYAFNFPALWKAYPGKALLMWGESDFISAKEDHEILTNTVNNAHPGNGTIAFIEHAGHGMGYAADFSGALAGEGAYNTDIGERMLAWLKLN